jgi:phosphatidylserine/phosphatidylglycerophosphate/cardiolipin synthase-like enzyme
MLALRDMADRPQSAAVEKLPARDIFEPGRNCWRVANAQRAAALVDGAAYFTQLDAALRKARRSIQIVGWAFDGSIRLRPDIDGSPALGPLLRSLVEENPDLEVHILVWSIAVLHAPGAIVPLLIGADWENHERITLKLDTQHPIYAAHHQKIVCIDDRLAFVGGMDLTIQRWDTCAHAIDDPLRCGADGKPYPPVHDIQLAVDGEAARALGELARGRWRVATGDKRPAHAPAQADVWPDGLVPEFTDVPVAIARTIAAWGRGAAVAEAAALTADCLAAARRGIYIEAQYMTASYIGDILVRHLSADDGPEIVVIMTHESHGFVEEMVMGNNRDRLIRRLSQADRHGRLRILYPCVPDTAGECRQVLVHSKLIIVDDWFARIGSSNMNNRSIGLDTECDLAIQASEPAARQAISNLRDRLMAEHLDAAPGELARAVEENGGSMIKAMERLNTRKRGLRPFEAMSDKGPTRPAFATPLLDPKKPFEPLWFLRRKKSPGTPEFS